MNHYLAKCTELNFLVCIQRGLWGQEKNKMSRWKPNDRLILYTKNGISGLFEITSNQFVDHTQVWLDKTYPYRVNINPLKVLSPDNRLSIKEHNIERDLTNLHGPGWGMKIVMGLNPIDPRLGKKIEELVQNQPSYDPFPTIEEDIERSTVSQAKKRRKIARPEERKIVELSKTEEKSLHDTTKNMIFEIGEWEGKYAEIEYEIGSLGKLDVVWKRIKTGHPAYVFEVQIKGNFYQALAKLKHAFDLWNSVPILVTTQHFVTQAEELLSGSFHEMGKQAKIINYEKIRELFLLEKKLNQLKEELDI